jgi:rhodanese-related sulfurtransferase
MEEKKMKKTSKILLLALLLVSLFSVGTIFAEGKTSADLLAEARAQILQVDVNVAKLLLDSGDYMFIDIREPSETKMGFIPGAIQIPRGLLEFKIASTIVDQNTPIVVYCKSGGRASLGTLTLKTMGYTNVMNMAGGWMAWEKAGYPIDE